MSKRDPDDIAFGGQAALDRLRETLTFESRGRGADAIIVDEAQWDGRDAITHFFGDSCVPAHEELPE